MKGGWRRLRPAEGLSRFLLAALLPLCIWGLMSSLLLHLIEIRSIFIQGGEGRLRLATLGFAAAIILLQRLASTEGKSMAKPYLVAIALAITAFALYNAFAFRLPIHPVIVFLVNEALFILLWWVGHVITRACAVDSPEALRASAESGILSRRQREKQGLTESEREAKWSERLPPKHPGIVLLYFSLFAIPTFGLGVYFFNASGGESRVRLGAFIFIYLWCAFALLCLSSLNQMRAYLEQREVSLPDLIGLTWLGLGLLLPTVLLVVAFLLPQPPSVAGSFVRDRMVSVYRGWETKHKLPGGGGATKQDPIDYEKVRERYGDLSKGDDKHLAQVQRSLGPAGQKQRMTRLAEFSRVSKDGIGKGFDFVLKTIFFLTVIGGIFAILVTIGAFIKGLSQGIASLQWARRKRRDAESPRRKRKRTKEEKLAATFGSFPNPFAAMLSESDGNEVVRRVWEATLAFCADFGTPCPPEQTPLEFVETQPAAFAKFEEPARFIAQLFTYSEFSGQPVSESSMAELRAYWQNLKTHAAAVLG